jgi:hypothetical protein
MMPLYSYRCPQGHLFDQQVKLDLSNAPTACDFPMPEGVPCAQPVERTLTAPSRSFPGADSWRR